MTTKTEIDLREGCGKKGLMTSSETLGCQENNLCEICEAKLQQYLDDNKEFLDFLQDIYNEIPNEEISFSMMTVFAKIFDKIKELSSEEEIRE